MLLIHRPEMIVSVKVYVTLGIPTGRNPVLGECCE